MHHAGLNLDQFLPGPPLRGTRKRRPRADHSRAQIAAHILKMAKEQAEIEFEGLKRPAQTEQRAVG